MGSDRRAPTGLGTVGIDLNPVRDASNARMDERINNFLSQAKNVRMADAIRLVREAARSRVPVLIQGEFGTGKSLAGRAIHELSGNRSPFIRIDCRVSDAALLETLATGAGLKHGDTGSGTSEPAFGGALLLARVDLAREALQRQLLRWLTQDPAFQEEGGSLQRHARIISTSESHLSQAVENGSFNLDLYRLLSSSIIEIPALRDRREDLLGLVNFFSELMDREFGGSLRFSPRGVRVLHRYSWPGNIRELENLIERMAITVRDQEVDADDLSPYTAAILPHVGKSENGTLDSLQLLEKRSVVSALERNRWVQSRAARELGITMRQMGYRIKKYDLHELVRQNRGLPRAQG